MYKLEIKLKQHTPLIHFQHEQYGATLRASEVKPKLDKFIQKNATTLKSNIFEKDEVYNSNENYKQFVDFVLSTDEKQSFPYKLSIRNSTNDIEKYIIASYISKDRISRYKEKGYKVIARSPYFADNKSIYDEHIDSEVKIGTMLNGEDTINIKFTFLDKYWKYILELILPVFFASTNFGARQNKGFGCFYPNNRSMQDFFDDLLEDIYPLVYNNETKHRNQRDIFNTINLLYAKLKAGNQRTESILKKYFVNRQPKIEWEKRAIKKNIENIILNRNENVRTDNIKFVRALLGLPKLYEYPKSSMKAIVKNSEGIERYASPIQFKVFDGYIFIMTQMAQSNGILNKKFRFEFQDTRKKYENNSIELSVPNRFDLQDFFEKAMSNQYGWEKL